MSRVIVLVETGAGGFSAYARQGSREHQATGTSSELAARIAAAGLLQEELCYVRAERSQPGIWYASVSTRRVA